MHGSAPRTFILCFPIEFNDFDSEMSVNVKAFTINATSMNEVIISISRYILRDKSFLVTNNERSLKFILLSQSKLHTFIEC